MAISIMPRTVFTKLTNIGCCDILTDMGLITPRVVSRDEPSPRCCAPTKTADNSSRTAGTLLFFRSPNPRRPRISAGNKLIIAEYFLQKQQKQRKVPCIAWRLPRSVDAHGSSPRAEGPRDEPGQDAWVCI